MSKKIDERIPQDSGNGAGFKTFNAVQSPWNKLYSYQEALHYASRFESVLSAAATQALRIIVPDYKQRAQMMCEEAYQRLYMTGVYYGNDDGFGIHPFMCGQYTGALIGDKGDDALLMCGRCQDFGTYRAEKSLTSATGISAVPSSAAPLRCPSRARPTLPPSAAARARPWTT